MSTKPYLNPYLNFNGNAREAMEFYHSVLGGDLSFQTFAQANMAQDGIDPEGIVHADLHTDSITIFASDAGNHGTITFGSSVNLSIGGDDLETLTSWFNKLSEGGDVDMPLAKMFWGDTFGSFTDKFGIHWMFNIAGSQASDAKLA